MKKSSTVYLFALFLCIAGYFFVWSGPLQERISSKMGMSLFEPDTSHRFALWSRLHTSSADRSRFGEELLTILVDSSGSCPDSCMNIHFMLPPWVQYRYRSLKERKNLDFLSHVLIVTRNVGKIESWVQEYKSRTGKSVGVFHMTDELNEHGGSAYGSFDYVLRNYYFDDVKNMPGDTYLRALGNLTCGTGPEWPSKKQPDGVSPRLGMHWVFLPVDQEHRFLDRDPQSILRMNHRSLPCSFVGSIRADRQDMVEAFNSGGGDLNCDFDIQDRFRGELTPFTYIHRYVADTKIGLTPHGYSPETHRLAEHLSQGTVPLMRRAPYQQATFEPIPAVIVDSWEEATVRVRQLLNDNTGELQRLSNAGAKFYHKMVSCQKGDLDLILSLAMEGNSTSLA